MKYTMPGQAAIGVGGAAAGGNLLDEESRDGPALEDAAIRALT
jgi:hypothetical protein